MVSGEPTVFISSTIRDFGDLRLALKWWFEERGYRVRLSECTDFDIDPASGTFENCLQGVRSSQYVVVLVGLRCGSFYSEAEGITITRREYREAYEGALAGSTKLVACLRNDVGEALASENWHAFGKEQEYQLVKDFVDEIKRNEEMRAASKTGGSFPVANWVYSFRDFRELTSALSSSFRLGGGLRRKALEANLTRELKTNIRLILSKSEGKLSTPGTFLPLQSALSITPQDSMRVIHPTQEQLNSLMAAVVSVAAFRIHELSDAALQDAISSGEFLEFCRSEDTYAVGKIQSEMLTLRGEISRLRNDLAAPQLQGIAGKLIFSQRKGIPAFHLAFLFGAANRLHNVLVRTAGLCAFLSGLVSGIPKLQLAPSTPMVGNERSVDEERPSYSEIELWIKEQFCKEE